MKTKRPLSRCRFLQRLGVAAGSAKAATPLRMLAAQGSGDGEPELAEAILTAL